MDLKLNFFWEIRTDFDKVIETGDIVVNIPEKEHNIKTSPKEDKEKFLNELNDYLYSNKFIEYVSFLVDEFDLKYYTNLILSEVEVDKEIIPAEEILGTDVEDLYIYFYKDEVDGNWKLDIVS